MGLEFVKACMVIKVRIDIELDVLSRKVLKR